MNLEQRNAQLDAKLEATDLPQAVEVLIKSAKKQKRTNWLLTISIVFDVLLTIGLAFGWHQNHSLVIKAESNRNAIIRNCETSNEARTKNKQLWDYILQIPPPEPTTPDKQAQVDKFKAFVAETFAPRDCSKVVK